MKKDWPLYAVWADAGLRTEILAFMEIYVS
jgi:hypothetical protein